MKLLALSLLIISNLIPTNPGSIGCEESTRKYLPVSEFKLKKKDLNHIPPSELRIIRNEIYASYGYQFKSKDLKKYFKSKCLYAFSVAKRPLGDLIK